MEQISVSSALQKIVSKSNPIRNKGLKNLRDLLKQKPQRLQLQKLNDKEFKVLFEPLFECVTDARTIFLSSVDDGIAKGQKTARSAVEVLSTCAEAIRLVVESCIQCFRSTTVRAILGHIVKTLELPGGTYCEPLVADYLRALHIILECQRHVEHLSVERWNQVVQVWQRLVWRSATTPEETHLLHSNSLSRQSSRSETPSATPATPLTASFASIRKAPITKSNVALPAVVQWQLLQDLQRLLALPQISASEISALKIDVLAIDGSEVSVTPAEVTFKVLESCSFLVRLEVQQYAFSCINTILARTLTENLDQAIHIFLSALVYVRRFWHAKLPEVVREEVLMILVYGECLLPSILSSPTYLEHIVEVQGLLDVLEAEFSKRTEKDIVQIDELDFNDFPLNGNEYPLRTMTCHPRSSSRKTEQTWTLLHSIAAIFRQLHLPTFTYSEKHSNHDDPVPARKRQRKDDPLLNYVRRLSSLMDSEKPAALQILAFACGPAKLDLPQLQLSLDYLIPMVSSEVNNIAIWAMLAISWLAHQNEACRMPDHDVSWLQVWQLAVRHITSSISCRYACHLLFTLLKLELVHSTVIADTVDSMLASVKSNGPATLNDAAITFLVEILKWRSRHRPAVVETTSEAMLQWLFFRWHPCKCSLLPTASVTE